MRVYVDEVRVPERRMRRGKATRNVSELAQSMDERGQLQPIRVDEDLCLVFGLGRLMAARELGWAFIEAEKKPYPSEDARLLDEIDENLIRHDLTALERVEHVSERVRVLDRMGLLKPKGRPRKALTVSEYSAGEVAESLGLGESTIRLYKQIEGALPPPTREAIRGSRFEDNLRELRRIARMEPFEQMMFASAVEIEKRSGEPITTGGVRDIQREIRRAQTRRLGLLTDSPTGRYRTIVIDPPWSPEISGDVDGPNGKVAPPYETWPLSRIAALPLRGWEEHGDSEAGEPDVHLYLWVTNGTLEAGLGLLAGWGYDLKHVLVWRKDRINPGRYFDHQHELCLFAAKGSRLPARNVPDVFDGKRGSAGEHSAKPEEFYEIVEAVSPGPRLELFAREPREGWSVWGAEVTVIDSDNSGDSSAGAGWTAASMMAGATLVACRSTFSEVFCQLLPYLS